MSNEYIPYGSEWESEMNKFPKTMLIRMLRKSFMENKYAPDLLEAVKALQTVIIEMRDYICYVSSFEGMPAKENAKLIAAAPELLKALYVMTSLCRLKYGNLDKDVYNEILKAEAAIAKAEGKEVKSHE